MDLLSTVLRTTGAEEYIENFRNFQIDCFTLKLLSDEDLKTIGINDEERRKKMLEHFQNLQTPTEQKVIRKIDKQYTKLFLDQCQVQLHKHFSNLICALKREDVDLCEIPLTLTITCLEETLNDLDRELENFKNSEVLQVKPKKKMKRNLLVPTIAATFLTLFLYRCYVVYTR